MYHSCDVYWLTEVLAPAKMEEVPLESCSFISVSRCLFICKLQADTLLFCVECPHQAMSTSHCGNNLTQLYFVCRFPPKLPPSGSEYQSLWGNDLIQLYLLILKSCTNPVSMEAAAGAIQNLTACDWEVCRQVFLSHTFVCHILLAIWYRFCLMLKQSILSP